MKFRDIPQLPQARYQVNVPWAHLEENLAHWAERGDGTFGGLNLDPDYQREHVWTLDQRIRYIEYTLMGGEVGRNITFNCSSWMTNYKTPIELVDGKQRIEAVRAFLRNEVPVFGCKFSDFEDKMSWSEITFVFKMCTLQTREEILQLYLNINAGGTPHTDDELNRVRALLEVERAKKAA